MRKSYRIEAVIQGQAPKIFGYCFTTEAAAESAQAYRRKYNTKTSPIKEGDIKDFRVVPSMLEYTEYLFSE